MAEQVNVLIVGGGPVGMITALELARYGIASCLIERNPDTTRHPKMDITNGRSMELFHRLGIADDIRKAGVDADNPFDVSWITDLNGYELHRFAYPSANQVRARIVEQNDGSQASQAPLRVSQIEIEPVLKRKIEANPLIDVRFSTRFERILNEAEDHLEVQLASSVTGEIFTVTSSYLIGCDGGGSRVRRSLGIALEGEPNCANAFMVHFHSTDTELLQRWGTTWHYQNAAGTLIAQNDIDTWTLQCFLPPGDDGSSWDADAVLQNWAGRTFDYTILQANPWTAHFVVAETYHKGRALIAGDAAHQYMPTGGYGMNSGVADAAGVAWVVAAQLQGWGGAKLLKAYEAERRQTAWWHLAASKRHLGVRMQIAQAYANAGDVSSASADAAANRRALATKIALLGNAENESWGVELGYCYQSPVICTEEAPPEIDPLEYRASIYAGCRLPHLFLEDGRSIHDKLGLYFTLIHFGVEPLAEIERVATQVAVPLSVLSINEQKAAALFEYAFVLVRPDQHIAWRGNTLPTDFHALLAQVTGH